MKVRDVMTTDVATATPETTLEDIATMMRDEDTGAIPVLDGDQLVGIITDRDIVIRCIAEGKDPVETTVEDVLSERLETIEPDADVEHAKDLMSRRQVRRLPVIEDGELVGMLSIGDLAVKSGTDMGKALENVSEGVKASGGSGKRASRAVNKRDAGDEGSIPDIESGRQANARAGREGGAQSQASRGNQKASRGNGGRHANQGNHRKQVQGAGKGSRIQESAVGKRKNVAGGRVEAKGGTRRRAS